MLARRDQENLVQAQPLIQGGKPIAQGIKAHNPKTPGNGRITPAARNRAPLGAKTSNVKQTAFKTPAPLAGVPGLQKTQRRSASARKPKLKIVSDVVPVEAEAVEPADEEPDIEYCPPKITPLEDKSDDELFPEGVTFPHLTGKNAMQGWLQLHLDEVGDDGLSQRERQEKRSKESVDAHCDRVILESLEATSSPEELTQEFLAMKKAAVERDNAINNRFPNDRLPRLDVDPKKKKAAKPIPPPTVNSRSAASALSARPTPNFAAPTVAARAKQTAALEPVKRSLASRSTIGYAKGKQVASTFRKDGGKTARLAKIDPFGFESEEQQELLRKLTSRAEEEEDDSPLFPEGDDWFEKQMRGFQLSLPEEDEAEGT